MKKKSHLFRISVLLIIALLFFNGRNISAQSRITTGVLETIWTPPDTILPIEGTDITSSAEASATIISEITSLLPDSAYIADLTLLMEAIRFDIDSVENEFKAFDQGEFKTKTVLNLRNTLSAIDADKETLKALLINTTDVLIEFHERINFLTQTWDASLQQARSQNLTTSLIDRSQQMVDASSELQEIITLLEEEIIGYSDELLNQKTRIDIMSTRLEELELHFEMIYLSKTHAALWEQDTVLTDTTAQTLNIWSELSETYGSGLSSFYDTYKIRIWINIVLFIVFLIISLVIHRDIRAGKLYSEDQRIKTFLQVFSRPFSISLLLALFIFLLLYPNAPVAAKDLGAFLIVIPLVLLSLQLLPRAWHPLLIFASVLFYFEEVVETLRYESFPLPRYFILIIVFLSLLFVIWMILKRYRTRKQADRRKLILTDIAFWLSLGLLIFAFGANISGYVAMSFFLLRGLIIAIMAGILIKVTITIVDGFLTLLIMGRSSQMLEVVSEYGNKLVARIMGVIKLFAIVYWTTIVLKQFIIYESIMEWLGRILDTKWVINDVTISVEGILLFAVIVFLSFWISRLFRLILEKEIYPRVHMARGIPGIISLLLRVGIITIGFIMSLAVLGINVDKLTIILGALGVGIGFGLQDIINNLISGFILVFERPIQVGDTVKFGDKEGIVKTIGIRASTIKTYDGMEVIVPNGKLISNELVNLTLSDEMSRIEINIGTDYGSDPQEVIDILKMQAKLHPDILKNPEPFVVFFGFGDFSLKFRLYTYTNLVQSRLRIRSELNLAISSAFKEAGIKIPYPIQDLNVKLEEKKDKE